MDGEVVAATAAHAGAVELARIRRAVCVMMSISAIIGLLFRA
ncbi:hypothetical protein L841_5495 [Mycobacterium sp. MAC_080597_8934]|nr:hypothetical protein L841_5495 [Mycobacterium sp. MAC_080597_8934]ETZ75506.1 hypothetical protein L840_1270 [Mycobacterium sp. MAC_011194_8550]